MVESRVEIYIIYMKVLEIANVGEKIVKTLFSNRVTSEKKRIHTPPLSAPFTVGVFDAFYS